MDELESITQLREWTAHIGENQHLGELTHMGVRGLRAIADAIERELNDRYVELPVDAEGAPVRVGDSCVDKFGNEKFVVSSVEWNGLCWSAWSVPEKRHICTNVVHGSPRTLEGLLREYGERVLRSGHQWGLDAQRAIIDCAEEIRELLGVDDGR